MFLKNSWYCAGWSDELGEEMVGRTIIGKPVLLLRNDDGEAKAMGGMCPHRFAPLWEGKRKGDNIMCPYHGLEFGPDGQCVHNPHGGGQIPKGTQIATYLTTETAGAIWVWMGDEDKADFSLLPKSDWLVNGDYACGKGMLQVKANYQLVADNLLDLTHAPYLHPETVGGDPEASIGDQMQHEFTTEENKMIHSNYLVEGMPFPTPQMEPLWGNRPGDFRAEMRWRPASTLDLDIRMSPVGGKREEGLHVPSFHFLVPESEFVTTYYFAIGRNVAIDNEEATKQMVDFAYRAFAEEDEPMIHQCQELMGTSDLMSLRPAILKTDIAGVQARRLLGQLIKGEAG